MKIDNDLFGKDNIDFLTNTMWLDLKHIQAKIKKDKAYFRAIFDLI